MNEIAEQVPHPPAELATGNALVSMIERAASNPAVDIDKMERLLQMQERVMAKQAETAFNDAMTSAQEEMPRIHADKRNKQTSSDYASYAQIDRAIRSVYTKNGFALSFDTGDGGPPEHVRVLCYVSHRAGHTRTYKADMPADGKGAKGGDVMTRTHATGSGIQYGKRYLLQAIFNLAIGDDPADDDGNSAGGKAYMSDDHAATIESLCAEIGPDMLAKVTKSYRVESVADIADSEYPGIVDRLQKIKAKA